MLLLRSWKDSLALFIPKNFKLFLLVSLKTAMETYGNLLYYFWWLILLVFVFEIGCYYPECILLGPAWYLIDSVLIVCLAFSLLMLVRPSVQPKGFHYFEEHAKKTAIGFVVLYFLFNFVRSHLGDAVLNALAWLNGQSLIYETLHPFAQFLYDQSPFIMLPPFVFSVLFYFDSNGTIKSWLLSIVRGIVMFVYNFPFCLISVLACFGLWTVLHYISPLYGKFLFFSFVPFVVSYFKTMYVKRVHDQFSLYYPNE
ncbi:MAG: hypothetical protein WD055_05810 [Candidatus Dependentiae bacterium]